MPMENSKNAQDESFLLALAAALKTISSEGDTDPEKVARRLLPIIQSQITTSIEAERVAIDNLLTLSSQELRLLGGEMTAQEVRTVKAVLENRAGLVLSGERRKYKP